MSTHAPLHWGLLGTARINRAIIDPIRSSKNSQLHAVASRSHDKAAAYAATWRIPHFHSSYEAMLTDPDIDVVYVSLPNSLHAEWSIKAMQKGKHVLCEKPLTTSVKDAEAVIAVAKETGRIITEAFMYRHHPQTLFVKQLVDQGEIGKLTLIRGTFCYVNTRQGDVRFDPALGGGSLWDIGCYPIGYARYLTGTEPIEVFGHQVTGSTGIDLLYAGQMHFPNNVTCQFECSFISAYKVEMEVTGDRGRITIPEPYKPGVKNKIVLQKLDHTKTLKIKGSKLYQGEIEDMENAILDGKPNLISLDDSKKNIATIEACYQSARLSRPIEI